MTNRLTIDVMAMVELARRHPEELDRLKSQIQSASHSPETGEAPWLPTDRFNRTLNEGSLVLTPGGDRGRVARFDRDRERAVVELDHGGKRTLPLSKIELRRGRPRKTSYAH